jgi:SAM-dependent methyltransferase
MIDELAGSDEEYRCRLNSKPLDVVLDLGQQPLGNGFLASPEADEYTFHLQCGFNEDSRLFQLCKQPAPELMFHDDYAFFTGTSKYMAQHFSEFSESIASSRQMSGPDPLIVEIGSNDGTFLKRFAETGVRHVGVEPSGDVAAVAEDMGIEVRREFFDETSALSIRDKHGVANVISAANVICHIPDIRGFAAAVESLLAEDGIFVFEEPYLGDVIEKTSYDQIYDEHVYLFSGLSVNAIFESVGLVLVAMEHQTTHGGSMRYTIGRASTSEADESVEHFLEQERLLGLHRTETYIRFAQSVDLSAYHLREELEDLRRRGFEVAGYGATSKSTTIYNYADIGTEHISYICDNSATKIGKWSPGVHIPIMPESRFRSDPPDVAFLAAWNHATEIRRKNTAFEEGGGRWLTHVPGVGYV